MTGIELTVTFRQGTKKRNSDLVNFRIEHTLRSCRSTLAKKPYKNFQ